MSSDTHPVAAVEAPVLTPDRRSSAVEADTAVAAPVRRPAPGEVITIVVLAFSTFVAFLSEMVLGVALPHVMRDLGISATTGQWLTTGYALTLAVIIPTTGCHRRRVVRRSPFRLRPGGPTARRPGDRRVRAASAPSPAT